MQWFSMSNEKGDCPKLVYTEVPTQRPGTIISHCSGHEMGRNGIFRLPVAPYECKRDNVGATNIPTKPPFFVKDILFGYMKQHPTISPAAKAYHQTSTINNTQRYSYYLRMARFVAILQILCISSRHLCTWPASGVCDRKQ